MKEQGKFKSQSGGFIDRRPIVKKGEIQKSIDMELSGYQNANITFMIAGASLAYGNSLKRHYNIYGYLHQIDAKLRMSYSFSEEIENNPDRFYQFLLSNSFLLPTLEIAPAEISKYFENSDLTLDFFGFNNSDTRIVIEINTSLSPEIAFEKYKEMNFKWWLDIMDKVDDKISIHYNFRK